MTRQEIISRIIELEMIVTEAVSKGHMAHTQDEYQPYREELKVLREKINFMSEVRVIEDLSKYEDYLTVGKLRKFLEEHSELPDDALVLTQRVEDKYYEKNGWGVVLKESAWYETEQEQYHPAWCCVKYNNDNNLYIDLHY